MENSKGCKRKHLPEDDSSDNSSSLDNKDKPGSSHAVTVISSNVEDNSSCDNTPSDRSSTADAPNPTDSAPSTMESAENATASNSDVRDCRRKPVCYSELPETVMNNIYRCLPLKDLISIGNVCDSWKQDTNRSSVWRHAPLSLHDNNVKDLYLTPYIHTVTGKISKTKLCVNAMVNKLKDLRKLIICFYPYITALQVFNLVSKFPNLECILLELSDPCILETLSVLQNCSNLKEIIFVRLDYTRQHNWRSFFEVLCNIKSLDTFDFYPFSLYVNSSDILYFLDLKMKQLVSLNVSFCMRNYDILNNMSTIVSKIICSSDKLEKLNFSFDAVKPSSDVLLNFSQVKNLKYLNLGLSSEIQKKVLRGLTFPATLEYAEIRFPNTPSTCRILEQIIMSCHNLKFLKVSYLRDSDINEQLEKVHTLQNLHTMVLVFCDNLSNEGLQHISKCSNLRHLRLSGLSVKDLDYEILKACKYLTMKIF